MGTDVKQILYLLIERLNQQLVERGEGDRDARRLRHVIALLYAAADSLEETPPLELRIPS
jgi:hypothetical protein